MKKILLLCLIALTTGCGNKQAEQTGDGILAKSERLVKSYSVHEYKYKFGELDSVNFIQNEKCEFDRGGNLTSRTTFDKGLVKFNYSNNTLTTEIEYDSIGNIISKAIFTYNDNLRTDSIYKNNGLALIVKRYKDHLDRDSLILEYDSEYNWKLSAKEQHKYDYIGLKEYYVENYMIGYSYKNERINEDKLLYTVVEKDEKGNITTSDNSYYDDSGRVLKYHRLMNEKDYKSETVCEYSYNGDSKWISERIFYKANREPTNKHIYVYEYYD